ncbi:hypothetical protein ACHAWF_016027 [Thalassiosira exigua]
MLGLPITVTSGHLYCIPCHPDGLDSDVEESSDESVTNGQEESKLDRSSKVSSFLRSHENTDDHSEPSAEEHIVRSTNAFASRTLHDVYGQVVDAKGKINVARAVVRLTLAKLLSGEQLSKAKKNGCFGRLQRALRPANTTVKSTAVPFMQLGQLIHEEYCQEDICKHCNGPFGESSMSHCNSVKKFISLFEVANSMAMDDGNNEPNESKKSGKREYSASMFNMRGIPNNFRYDPEMTDAHPCPGCGHCFVQRLVKEAEFDAESDQLNQDLVKKKAEYNSKPKSARSSQPPRKGRRKLRQKFICPCWSFSGKKVP